MIMEVSMEKLARWIYGWLESMHRKPVGILYDDGVRQDLQTLEPTGDTPRRQKEYVIQKIAICITIVLCGASVALILWIKEGMDAQIVDNLVIRNPYGEGARSVSLVADDGSDTYEIAVDVEEKEFTYQELSAMAQEMLPLLERDILGRNQDLDDVEYDLVLPERIDGYPFEVEWRTDDMYIGDKGKLLIDVLDTPMICELTAVLTCGPFELEHIIPVMVHTKAVQPGMAELLEREVISEEAGSRGSDALLLPSKSGGRSIGWRYKKSHYGVFCLAAVPVLAAFAFWGRDRDLRRQVRDREEQMRLDHPEIVSTFALLVGAGMTVPNAWNKIAGDYKARRQAGGPIRPAYEEMLLTVHEIESGVAQVRAYERFGRRCRIPDYNRLSTLLSQNIRKGTAELPSMLKAEAKEAFESRKHMAKKLGEQAGTKLLVPMMMLLAVTMAVIMVPAFRTYL